MESDDVITFLVTFLSAATTVLLFRAYLQGHPLLLLPGLASLAMLAATAALGSLLHPGQNLAASMLADLLQLNRPHCVSAALGVTLSLPFLTAGALTKGHSRRFLWLHIFLLTMTFPLAFTFGGLLAGRQLLAPYLARSNTPTPTRFFGNVEPGFQLELLCTTRAHPVRLAVDDEGQVFVSGQWGVAAHVGVIVRLDYDEKSGTYTDQTVASSLNRPHGLAIRDGEIFVSRSGQHTHARNGQLVHESTGAVTRLRDLDGDGIMDFYEDIVTGLPGSQGSDTLHQNSGMAFGPDGSLYMIQGANSDRDPLILPWEGAILRVSPDFKNVEVFARGFRNPFGLTFGPDGELFATESDVDTHPGDELNHIIEGEHYGHPYVVALEPNGGGVRPPIHLSVSAMTGLAYTEAPALPPEFRNCLYVVLFGRGSLVRVRVQRQGDTYVVENVLPFAKIPGAVDLAIDQDGVFYVSCYEGRRIYRIRFTGEP
jgi:glucose/arabinose dehydrogenase